MVNIEREKILFLSSRIPYPPIGGDRLKNYWLLKILSKYYKVHLVSISDKEIPLEFYEWANSIGITYKIFIKPRRAFIFNVIKGILNNLPLQVNYYFFGDIKNYIESIYDDYDLIFSTLIRTAKYVMYIDKPKILDMADSIGLNYKSSSRRTSSLMYKLIYTIEANRLIKFERKCVKLFNNTLFFNKREESFFRKYGKTTLIPHGVNEKLLIYDKYDERYKNCIVFFGKMNYQPNIDAVLWFVKRVLPLLPKNLKFLILGASPTRRILKLKKKFSNIEVTGFVDDPYVILKSALCTVAPMQTGGGIQNKILESMALGTINIVSSLAAQPIGGINMRDFIVEDDPEKIATIIKDIYKNPQAYDHIKKSAREFIKNHFTWSIYEKKLISVIEEVLTNN